MSLTLTLLGGFEAKVGEQPVSDFPTQKSRALLVYLALAPDGPQQRQRLSWLFWPDSPESAALGNLRKDLHRLQQTLARHDPRLGAKLLTVTRRATQLNQDFVSSDVSALEALLAACEAHPHRDEHACAACLERLEAAAALYGGPLLEGLELPDTPAFDEWLLLKRSNLQNMMLIALENLANGYEKRGDHARALSAVVKRLSLDPYLEAAHRQRMRLLAKTGQTNEALVHYEAWQRLVREEIGLEPEPATVELYEALRSGTGSLQLAEPSPMHHFPSQFSGCRGREQELLELLELLLGPDCRLLTILGSGGVGKTRLAVALAEGLAAQGEFPGGFFFFPLAHVTSAERLWSALALGLGVTLVTGDDARTKVLAFLHTKVCLLVLDNFEQLTEASQHTTDILEAAPGVRLLVTSRAPLNVRAEHRFSLEGLAYPDEPNDADVPDALAYSAIALFVEAARRVQPGFRLASENSRDVIRICRMVAGLPLALELAAAWMPMLDCGEIAREIDRNVNFLKSTLKDVPERHNSMGAVFAYSWNLLAVEAQHLLAQLSVFQGPFGLEAVLNVTGASVRELATLLDHSLLKRTAIGEYSIHELVRQCASERLDTLASLSDEVKAQHSRYYLNLVAGERTLHGPSARQTVTALQRQLGDIRTAWGWAVEHHSLKILDASLEGLFSLYDFIGLFDEAAALLGDAIASERRVVTNPTASTLLSPLLIWQAHFLNQRGQSEAAITVAQEGLALAERRGNRKSRAKAHHLLGELLLFKGDYAQAKVYQQLALAFFEELGVSQPLADALSRMGVISWRTGDYAGATMLFERALPLQHELGDAMGRAQVLSSVAGIYWEQGDLERARTYLQQAAEVYEALDYKMGKAYSVGRLGIIHQSLGNYEQALVCNGQALGLFGELSYVEGRAHYLGNRGIIYHHMGEFDQALDCHRQALQIDSELGHEGDVARHLSDIAAVLKTKGDIEEALSYYNRALPQLRAVGSNHLVLDPLLGKAEVVLAQAQYEEAAALAQEGLALARELGHEDNLVVAQVLLAKLAAVAGGDEAAVHFLRDRLAATEGREQQASLYYELWLLGQDDARAPGLVRYQELCERYPNFTNKTRLEELQQTAKPL